MPAVGHLKGGIYGRDVSRRTL